jgi:3'(2'), 5'-bisphosphate nucleotidase
VPPAYSQPSTGARPEAGDGAAGIPDVALARLLADRAGAALLQIRAGAGVGAAAGGLPELTGQELKDAGDRRAQEVLAALLAEYRPADAVLSEEAADSSARLTADRVWIIDPLDGTREFSERPRSDWAVHIALWQRIDAAGYREAGAAEAGDLGVGNLGAGDLGVGDLIAGAVALPAESITFGTDVPPVVQPRSDGPIRLAVSRSRPPGFVLALAESLGAELVPMGSAGVKCASVWRGQADAYVHGGGQYEWDSAAPVVVARRAGLHTSRLDGSELEYNRPDPLLPDLVVCRPELADRILRSIAEVNP